MIPCKPRTKVPVLPGWQNLVLSEAAIDAWWEDDPQYNVGVATGSRSGLHRCRHRNKKGLNGEADLRKLEEEHGPLPSTVEVITPNGPGGTSISAPIVRSAVATLPMALRSRRTATRCWCRHQFIQTPAPPTHDR